MAGTISATMTASCGLIQNISRNAPTKVISAMKASSGP